MSLVLILGIIVLKLGCSAVFGKNLELFSDFSMIGFVPPSMTLDKLYVESKIQTFISGFPQNVSPIPVRERCVLKTFFNNAHRVGVFDVGSTGIRFLVADVDLASGEVHPVINFEYSMPFGLSDEDSLQRLAAIGVMRKIAEEHYCVSGEMDFRAVATAGFRSAGEKGKALAQEIENVTGVSFNVIDQEREGALVFLGANLEYPYADMSSVVVWDIGGGSMQITMMGESTELVMAGCEIAARTFLNEAMTQVKGGGVSTPNPMTSNEVSHSIELAKALLLGTSQNTALSPFDGEQIGLIESRIQSQDYVLGVGGVHARIVLPSIRAMIGVEGHAYTPELLLRTIQAMVDSRLGDSDIRELLDVSSDSVSSILTSLILVYATLELFDIQEVRVLNINNTQGLVAEFVEEALPLER